MANNQLHAAPYTTVARGNRVNTYPVLFYELNKEFTTDKQIMEDFAEQVLNQYIMDANAVDFYGRVAFVKIPRSHTEHALTFHGLIMTTRPANLPALCRQLTNTWFSNRQWVLKMAVEDVHGIPDRRNERVHYTLDQLRVIESTVSRMERLDRLAQTLRYRGGAERGETERQRSVAEEKRFERAVAARVEQVVGPRVAILQNELTRIKQNVSDLVRERDAE
jgi:hypothetical protein